MKMIEYYYCVSFLEPPGGGQRIDTFARSTGRLYQYERDGGECQQRVVLFFHRRAKSERPFDFVRKKTFNLPVVEAYVRPRHSPLILVCTSFDDH